MFDMLTCLVMTCSHYTGEVTCQKAIAIFAPSNTSNPLNLELLVASTVDSFVNTPRSKGYLEFSK